MAGDWIKMRHALLHDSRVIGISDALKTDKFRVIGGLFAVWCLADTQTTDGRLARYKLSHVDAAIGWKGFTKALADVGWAKETPEGVEFPGYDQHNGETAKRRAQESERKRSVRKLSASDADRFQTREEKSRGEKSRGREDTLSPGVVRATLPSARPSSL